MVSKKKVLIADDDQEFVQLVKYNLERDDIEVIASITGKNLIESVRTHLPEVIISNWLLPEISGLELCCQVKKEASLAHIPFFLLVHQEDEINFTEVIEQGVDDYFVKPVRIKELVDRTKHVLISKPQEPTSNCCLNHPVRMDDLLLDTERYKVYIDQKKLELNSFEFHLLKLFVCNPNKVFSYGQIRTEMSAFIYSTASLNLDLAISMLRNKLGKFKHRLERVEGVGYRLSDSVTNRKIA